MKLNACILLLAHMVYNLYIAFINTDAHNWRHMSVTPLMILFIATPPFYLLGNPPFWPRGANARPLLFLFGGKLIPLALNPPPSLLNGPPTVHVICSSKTILQHQIHIVWYNFFLLYFEGLHCKLNVYLKDFATTCLRIQMVNKTETKFFCCVRCHLLKPMPLDVIPVQSFFTLIILSL